MRIGELASRTGVSVRSLRHYEKAGLLSSRRLTNGYRWFDAEAIDRVHRIRVLLSTGLSIADINVLSSCFDEHPRGGALCRRAQARYRQKLDVIDRQIGMLQEIRARIIKLIQPEEGPF
ncbi:MAG: MerR family transcriptional regulator [Syntrophorhabdales bacterium]|jgi:DNA-binding transcriptional MerR regulator